ncbi:MAG: hypothetical protein NZ699_12200 [Roseiflexus sp.]|nr:hypothetical protein [Roseiflexus sp.]MDW8145161.1 hypothetical protein [Roseiflexaceae bacterium]MDW8234350.1 hypothetical protein [Roseiflexaceae bacterium]
MTSIGYMYRLREATGAEVRSVVRQCVGVPCWTFGGASLWDVVPEKGRENLRPITRLGDIDHLDITGDFGHAFSERAEVRWKRLDDDAYDVLILSETELFIEDACPLTCEGAPWEIERPTKAMILQTDDRPAIKYVLYRAPLGALQLVRLAGLAEEKQR